MILEFHLDDSLHGDVQSISSSVLPDGWIDI